MSIESNVSAYDIQHGVCLNRCDESFSGSNLFVGLSFSGGDACSDLADFGNSALVLLELDDGYVGWVDGNLIWCSVGFVFGELVDVDGPFLSMDLDDFALSALVGPSEDDDLVLLSNGN